MASEFDLQDKLSVPLNLFGEYRTDVMSGLFVLPANKIAATLGALGGEL